MNSILLFVLLAGSLLLFPLVRLFARGNRQKTDGGKQVSWRHRTLLVWGALSFSLLLLLSACGNGK